MMATVNATRIDTQGLIKKHMKNREKWDQDFTENYQTYAVELATRIFQANKAMLERRTADPYQRTLRSYSIFTPLNLFKDTFIREITNEINIEPFRSWLYAKAVGHITNPDNKYFTNLMDKVAKETIKHLSNYFKNYLTSNLQFRIEINDEEDEYHFDIFKDKIKTTITLLDRNNIVMQPQDQTKFDLFVLKHTQEIRANWSSQFDKNLPAYSSKLAENIFEEFKINYEAFLKNPCTRIKETFKKETNIYLFHANLSFYTETMMKVSTSTKLEPFYQWSQKEKYVMGTLVITDENYFSIFRDALGKATVPKVLKKLEEYFTEDYTFSAIFTDADPVSCGKVVKVEAQLIKDPIKNNIVTIDVNDPNLLNKKNN